MNLDSRFLTPPHVMARLVGDETVILDLASGTYFGLDEVGARIWQLLTEGQTVPEICRILVEEFEVTLDVVQTDVQLLLNDLESRGLVISSK